MDRKTNETMVDALILLGGGVLGAGLALLFAPQSGQKSRKDIARFSRTVGRKSDLAMRKLADNVIDFADAVAHRRRHW
ncbi:YtxH domain-containing protein [Geomonas sp. RF6]|uniref:YtxH domain-containing protein n=1 Tax=Geomonas sp. RF6 TaxID=2897342 RepID=UPI001E5ACF80|nr:YtxH domain-containing protein [Geomonas sp. RF6]UFS68542.1 YtxH domain-containing protein [Geomonas sp. RF6]